MTPAPLDLTHLRRQTGGDANLEREVLLMFSAKAATDVGRIAQARSAVERREAAHALLGSARAVGALEVARLAALAEQRDDVADGDLTALRDAVAAARAFIERHLAR